jgi:2-oxoglutarate dehydrogenase E2 component (dihydrolipoamide succinyltransferase)
MPDVIMPQMGESVAEGTITKWLKKTGERVERDEPLFEISTDKVDAEIPSPAAGILAKVLVEENQTVPVNTVVAVIDGEGAPTEAAAPAKPSGERTGPASGSFAVSEPAHAAAVIPPIESEQRVEPATCGATPKVRSSPLVRRIAREHNVDLTRVQGTGLEGRVSKKDILTYVAQQESATVTPAPPLQAPTAPSPTAPSIVFSGPTYTLPMTPMRRQIAEHMVTSRRTSAHVTTVFEVEMTTVAEMRERHAAEFERRYGLKLTYTPFLVRAAVEGIREFRILNSSVGGNQITYKRDINIGVAVALETGLIVPVIKRADEKNFLGIARAVQELAERARSKRLSVDDVQGGTFTITNPGVFGSLMGTPIINQPQVAILGIGVIEKRPVVRNDAIAIRPMVYQALSFDHRIIDGAIADQFMGRIKSVLENWQEPVL